MSLLTKLKNKEGFSMLEALVSIGIAAILLTSMIAFVLLSQRSSVLAIERQEANWYINQGIEATRSLDFADLSTTTTGRVAYSGNLWSLATDGAELIDDTYTRRIQIDEVLRDGDCDLVVSAGTVDADSFYITSEISWTDSRNIAQTLSSKTLRTNWESPIGTCFATEIASLDIDISGVAWFGGKQLRDIYITNSGTSSVSIDKLTFWWTNGALMDQIFIDTTKIWSSGGPGTPTGKQLTGSEIDVVNTVIAPGSTIEIKKVQFDATMTGSTIQFEVEMIDGSEFLSPVITPS